MRILVLNDRLNTSLRSWYFAPYLSGFKTRTAPMAVTGGLMWHGGDGRGGRFEALRHECSEGDGLGPYGWVEHDGRSYGKQDIDDEKAGVRLVTSMVKPAQLDHRGGSVGADGGLAAADGERDRRSRPRH